jgi:hypothetical protein
MISLAPPTQPDKNEN